MGAAGYTEYRPDPRLARHVGCAWSSDVADGADASHAVLPDGCIDLLFDATHGELSVVGTMTRALWVRGCGPARFVGIRFRPGAAVPFLRERADLLTDQLGDPETLFGRDARPLASRLVEAHDTSAHRRLLEEFLLQRAGGGIRSADPRIAWAVSALEIRPCTRVEALAVELGLSRQYLRRLFLRETGIAPKLFARIMRLKALVSAMGCHRPLAELAFVAGYSDQAHMTHEFRSLVGATPAEYRPRVSNSSSPA